MAGYLLGIDNGATVSKVVIFDLHGHTIQVASEQTAAHYPQPGWVERSTEQLWQSTAAAIRAAISAAGIRPAQISAVGTCGHGNGLYLLDRQGATARPGILSMDAPAAQSPKQIPRSRAVSMVSQSNGTVFIRLVADSSGT